MSPDPIFHPHMSPYVGMDDNPVALCDPAGLSAVGNVLRKIGSGFKRIFQKEKILQGRCDVGITTVPTKVGQFFQKIGGFVENVGNSLSQILSDKMRGNSEGVGKLTASNGNGSSQKKFEEITFENSGRISNADGDLNYADNPPYPSTLVKYSDKLMSNDLLEDQMIDALMLGTSGIDYEVGKMLFGWFKFAEGRTLYLRNDNFSQTLSQDERFIKYATKVENYIISSYLLNGTITGQINPLNQESTQKLPNFNGHKSVFLFATIGGVQQMALSITNIYTSGNSTYATLEYHIRDAFGAGKSDGSGIKAWLPGLSEMYVLQHYRNLNNNSLYRPFVLDVAVQRTIKLK